MYKEYFGLTDLPFSIAPNPQYLYMSGRHREALAHLLYGIKSDGGFLLLTGEVGTGKTTVCRCLLQQVPDNVDTAYVLNPKMTATEMLATICDELNIAYPDQASIKILVDKLNAFLLESHRNNRRTLVIIDEAQNLTVDVLEQLRLLTNLETNQRKLIQIVLLGQPELLTLLANPKLRQLSQRVTSRFHLDALNKQEVEQYIQHRLNIAGAKGQLFPLNTVRRIYRISQGIPRLINLICDRALLGTYTQNQNLVTIKTVNNAAHEVLGPEHLPLKSRPSLATGFIVLLLFLVVGLGYQTFFDSEKPGFIAHNPTSNNDTFTVPNSQNKSGLPSMRSLKNVFIPQTNTPISDPNQLEGIGSRVDAFSVLFKLWDIEVIMPPSSSPCALASDFGLGCLSKHGSIDDLRHINRPNLISLVNSANQQQRYIISSITDSHVTLKTLDHEYRVSHQSFLASWDGAFITLWRQPPAFKKANALGDKGPSVDWLASQLALLEGSNELPTLGSEFDSALEARVKNFQISAGLTPSGIVGPETWIHLNGIDGTGIPFTQRRGG